MAEISPMEGQSEPPNAVETTDREGAYWGPWTFAELPCDYGERFVDPMAKTCRSVEDCVMLPVPWDCCGSVFLTGVNKKEAERYLQLASNCRAELVWCSCKPRGLHAEDGGVTDSPDIVLLDCIQGMCTTTMTRL